MSRFDMHALDGSFIAPLLPNTMRGGPRVDVRLDVRLVSRVIFYCVTRYFLQAPHSYSMAHCKMR